MAICRNCVDQDSRTSTRKTGVYYRCRKAIAKAIERATQREGELD